MLNVVPLIMAFCFKFVVVSLTNNALVTCTAFSLISQQHMLVGVGMICPYIINISVLLGELLSWGLMWPLIDTKKGDWYPADLKPDSLNGLQGYKVSFLTRLR